MAFVSIKNPMQLLEQRTLLPCMALAAVLCALPAHAGKTLDAIKARGQLVCGVNTGLAGFAATGSNGQWSGIDVDVCRAVAAAVLGNGDKVKYVPLNSQQRFAALQSGEIDLLARNTSFTLSRDASLGLHITAVTYYDGQAFMVPKKSGITSAKQLKGQTICVQSGTTTERNLSDFSRTNNLGTKPVVFDKFEAATSAYFAGRCIAYTTDASGLASVRTKAAGKPNDHVILPELISKEPLGPMVRRGDDEWLAIVKWTIHGLMEAEELGVTQANAAQRKVDANPAVQRLLGSGEDIGKLLGLDKEWLLRAIQSSGNYGEMFERNLGPNTPLGLPRGINHLWNKGGLMYALPLR